MVFAAASDGVEAINATAAKIERLNAIIKLLRNLTLFMVPSFLILMSYERKAITNAILT
jgi:putative effector of murein hydrolase LrgA (UPF0299 family)